MAVNAYVLSTTFRRWRSGMITSTSPRPTDAFPSTAPSRTAPLPSSGALIVGRVFINGYAGNDTITPPFIDAARSPGPAITWFTAARNDYLGGTGDDARRQRQRRPCRTSTTNATRPGARFDWSTPFVALPFPAPRLHRCTSASPPTASSIQAEATRQGHYFRATFARPPVRVRRRALWQPGPAFTTTAGPTIKTLSPSPTANWTVPPRARLQGLGRRHAKPQVTWDAANSKPGGRFYWSATLYNFTCYPVYKRQCLCKSAVLHLPPHKIPSSLRARARLRFRRWAFATPPFRAQRFLDGTT